MPFGSIEYFIGSLITLTGVPVRTRSKQRFDIRRVHAEYTQNSLAGPRCPARWCHESDIHRFHAPDAVQSVLTGYLVRQVQQAVM